MIVTTEIKLKPEIITLIRANLNLKNLLQLGLSISSSTLTRYLDNNSDKLTTATALKIIGQELALSNDELLSEN